MTSSSPLTFRCTCGQKLKAAPQQGGRSFKCPACGSMVTVPYSARPTVEPLPRVFVTGTETPPLVPVSELPSRVIRRPQRRGADHYVKIAALVAGVSLLAALVVGATIAIVASVREPSLLTDEGKLTGHGELVMAQGAMRHIAQQVRDSLKSPSGAVFNENFTYSTRLFADQRKVEVTINTWVEGPNAYGVPIREKIWGVAYLEWSDDIETAEWRTWNLTLGNQYIVQSEDMKQIERWARDYRETDRFDGRGNKTTREFTIYSQEWRYQVQANEEPVTVLVEGSLGDNVSRVDVEAFDDPITWVEARGTFRLHVQSRGHWKIVVQEPIP